MIDDPYATTTPLPWLDPDSPTALCAEVDASLWFPEGGQSRSDGATFARRLCRACPLQVMCRDWAVAEHVPAGIFGGLSPAERTAYRLARRAA